MTLRSIPTMFYIVFFLALAKNIVLSYGIVLNETNTFSADLKTKAGEFLIKLKFPEFESTLHKIFASPEGRHLKLTSSYEIAMHEILQSLKRNFVVLDTVLADHVLIPQCACQENRAFILEYKVRNINIMYTTSIEEKLKKLATEALDKIKKNNYALFVSPFHHVKEIVKIGLAFSNRNATGLVYEVEQVNSV